MTQEEKEKLYQNNPSAVDRGLKKAMEVLNKRRCANHTLAFYFLYIGTYILFTIFVLPHTLHSNANVCISFSLISINFLKHL